MTKRQLFPTLRHAIWGINSKDDYSRHCFLLFHRERKSRYALVQRRCRAVIGRQPIVFVAYLRRSSKINFLYCSFFFSIRSKMIWNCIEALTSYQLSKQNCLKVMPERSLFETWHNSCCKVPKLSSIRSEQSGSEIKSWARLNFAREVLIFVRMYCVLLLPTRYLRFQLFWARWKRILYLQHFVVV